MERSMPKAHILIVEDEAVVAADLGEKLQRAGYSVVGIASRGEQALAMVKRSRPDLVLMDIRLGGSSDGIETATSMKALTDIPVIFLTAHSDDDTIKRARLIEPFGYILKPFQERDLTTQIEIALYKYQSERTLRDSEARYRALAEELEQRVAVRTGELVQSQARLRALAAELNLTEQRERKRLADDLHDHLAQLLALGRLQLAQAKPLAQAHPGCAALVEKTMQLLDQSLTYTRTLVADLSPPVLHDFGLYAALKWLGEYMGRYDLTVTVQWSGREELNLREDQSVLLFQSVRELLINAAKYAGCGRALISVCRLDDALAIEVRDDGRGFDPEALSSDLTPTSSKFGLFSIRERMIAMGGSFEIQASPGGGTNGTLTLPLPSDDVLEVALDLPSRRSDLSSEPSPASPPEDHDTRVRVLLVDDHTVVRQGFRTLLECSADIAVVGEAGDGVEAVHMVGQLRPDVVVMDVNMPRMDGVEATRRIKEECPSVIIIGLSMHNSAYYGEQMRAAGAEAYLTKESACDHLYETILKFRSGVTPEGHDDLTAQRPVP
jgi:DNA-binding NarL/FixJ family response regulator